MPKHKRWKLPEKKLIKKEPTLIDLLMLQLFYSRMWFVDTIIM